MNKFSRCFLFLLILIMLGSATACGGLQASKDNGKLNVVATSTLVSDTVRRVAGDAVNLTTLMPVGSDPHNYQPVPQDIAAVARADVVFVNGLGFEAFLDDLIANAGGKARVVVVSEGVSPLALAAESDSDGGAHDSGGVDPHVWFDPQNVVLWTENVAAVLASMDGEQAAVYAQNAAAYEQQLRQLDSWIETQIATIPPAQRIIVTDHDALGYFVHRYAFQLVGAVIPSFSTAAAPSAQELAQLQQAIATHGVQAIFVGTTMNSTVAAQIARDTGIQLVPIYTGSLGDPGGPAATYLDFMRYNVTQIVQALP